MNDSSAVIADQYVALANMVGRANDAFFFHLLNQPRGPVIADLQVALNEAR